MKNFSIGLKTQDFFWKGGEFLKNWPGAYARTPAEVGINNNRFQVFQTKFCRLEKGYTLGY
jgi:hypothetical protein